MKLLSIKPSQVPGEVTAQLVMQIPKRVLRQMIVKHFKAEPSTELSVQELAEFLVKNKKVQEIKFHITFK
jgi:hypothetical protein